MIPIYGEAKEQQSVETPSSIGFSGEYEWPAPSPEPPAIDDGGNEVQPEGGPKRLPQLNSILLNQWVGYLLVILAMLWIGNKLKKTRQDKK